MFTINISFLMYLMVGIAYFEMRGLLTLYICRILKKKINKLNTDRILHKHSYSSIKEFPHYLEVHPLYLVN